MSRFDNLNEDDLAGLIHNKNSKNTHKVMQTAVQILEDYLKEKSLDKIDICKTADPKDMDATHH